MEATEIIIIVVLISLFGWFFGLGEKILAFIISFMGTCCVCIVLYFIIMTIHKSLGYLFI